MVEIYFEKELSDIVFESDVLEEWKNINEELGLKGQVELARGTKSPIPFPFMNKKMVNVCQALCPMITSIEDYDKSPIPIEILRQAKFAINEKHFAKLKIWYDDKSPDPFMVGETGDWYGYLKVNNDELRVQNAEKLKEFKTLEEYQQAAEIMQLQYPGSIIKPPSFQTKDKYLIGRWGDQLRDFKELTELAIKKLTEEFTSETKAEIAKMEQKLASIVHNVPLFVSGQLSKYEVSGKW